MRNLWKVAALLVIAPLLVAQNNPCGPESHLFDFWIGEWEVFSGDAKVGENSIKPILDGCVLQETWTGENGSKGTSLNYYNPDTKEWNQFWVWRKGKPLPMLTGQYKDNQMTLAGVESKADGSKLFHRITWTKKPDGTVRQHWENGKDGKAWTTSFDGLYKKKS